MAERVKPSERRMSEAEARSILQAVVSTHEQSLSVDQDFDTIAGFSTNQIRKAALRVGEVILRGSDLAEKHDQSIPGTMNFWIENSDAQDPRQVCLDLTGPELMIEARFPVAAVLEPYDKSGIHFIDTTSGKGVTLSNFGQPLEIDRIKHLFRGTRWMFANMLNWKGKGYIMLNQLDRLSLEEGKFQPLPAPQIDPES